MMYDEATTMVESRKPIFVEAGTRERVGRTTTTDWINVIVLVLTLGVAVVTLCITARLHKVSKSTDEHIKVLATAAKVQTLGLVAEHLRTMRTGAWNAALLCETKDFRITAWQRVISDLGNADKPLVDIEDIVGHDDTQIVRAIVGLANGLIDSMDLDDKGNPRDPEQAQRNMAGVARYAQPLLAKLDIAWREQLGLVNALQHELREVPPDFKVTPREKKPGEIQGSW